jgi:hypothetical protein
MGFAIQNQRETPAVIDVEYSPASECKSDYGVTVLPGKFFASHCSVSDVSRITVSTQPTEVLDQNAIQKRTRKQSGVPTVSI